jgi:catechol 2,3-dioxygenase-like lactoylglutathione lyase family enzyme
MGIVGGPFSHLRHFLLIASSAGEDRKQPLPRIWRVRNDGLHHGTKHSGSAAGSRSSKLFLFTVAFAVPDRAAVDRFYASAVGAGGRDNGKPGLRPNYHPYYYGAFVLDPDGHNIEAVCRHPA